ncbi:MAG: hypothetical protein HYW26_05995 [Candidatus Aenigmarchaeota archaeon]|nr:hypothetical protein [Candidatus Aenigmarchaeota archaeon]
MEKKPEIFESLPERKGKLDFEINKRTHASGFSKSFRFTGLIVIIIAAVFFSLFASPSAAQEQTAKFCFSGTSCRGGEICETQTCVDFSGNTETSIVSCSSCGVTSAICRDGSSSSCSNTCQDAALGARCVGCNALSQCGAAASGRQKNILSLVTFDVSSIQVEVNPPEAQFPNAQPAAFEVFVKNPLPVDILLQFAVSAPTGWSAETVSQVQLKAGASQSIPLAVAPPQGTAAGRYEIKVAAVNTKLKIASVASVIYIITPSNAPTLSVTPQSFKGTPDQRGFFTITVTDNNPSTFPSSAYILDVKAPSGWVPKLSSRSVVTRPSESKQVSLEIQPNSTPDEGAHQIEVRMTTLSNTTTSSFISYTITLCGDGICQVGEEGASGSCAVDCPLTDIKCSGRCESELDWGVNFKANIDSLTTRFIVCRRGSTAAECEAAFVSNNCGAGKPCVCGSSLGTECDARCVDTKGVYYMAAKSVGKTLVSANYSYACPFVNLNEILDIRDDFLKARTEYEKSHSALEEIIRRTSNTTEKAKYQPCSQGLELIADNITDFASFLNGVIEFPGKQNTTLARARALQTQLFIENTFSTYCKTTLGILHIDKIEPPGNVEVGKKATARVDVKNIGNVNYYGYVECDFVSPSGRPERERSSCTSIPQGTLSSSSLSHDINASGDWKFRCRVIGSLKSDCSSEVHDESALLSFDAFSREIFVQDVAAAKGASGIVCSVRTSRTAQCVGCRLGTAECRKIRQSAETTAFECPSAAGQVSVSGYVFPTADCVPAEPKSKTATARIEGCGDGVKGEREECEANENACSQTPFICDDATKKYGERSETGICSACSCVQSDFAYKCVADKCGATCDEGDERPSDEEGCVMKCGDACDWVKDCSGKHSFVFDPLKSLGTSKGGASVDYISILRNEGPETDSYAFNPNGTKIFIDGQESYQTGLEPGAQKEIRVRVVPGTKAEGDEQKNTVEIQSAGDGKRTAEYVTIISALTNAPPYMANIAHDPPLAKIGEQIAFYADIIDPEGDAIASAAVCGDETCSSVLCSLTFEGISGTCVYNAERSGEQSYYVVAKDVRDGISISSGRAFRVDQPAQLRTLDDDQQVTENTDSSMIFNVILIAFLILAAGLAYHFRENLKERISALKVWWNYRFG